MIKYGEKTDGAQSAVSCVSGGIVVYLNCFKLASCSAVALILGSAAIGQAQAADAFGITGQSAYFNGMSNAGAAAGGDISSMYWNPAATATLEGFNTSSSITGAFISVRERANSSGALSNPFLGLNPSTDVGQDGLPLSSFATYQLSDRAYVGLGINAPFGLTTKADHSWEGSPLATTSRIFSIDANPTVAYKLTPEITVGAGVQFLYLRTKLDAGGDALAGIPNKFSKENGWGLGAAAGIMWQPREGTSFGLGYRSRVDVDLHGNFGSTALGPFSPTSLNATVPLPDQVTFSARQAITNRLTVLGTVEWQNWSRLGTVTSTSPLGSLGPLATQNFNYQDRWSVSGGLEYLYSPSLTLRTGIGFDRSPVSNSVRDIVVPDSNDIALSIGASYRYSSKITVDFAYSHFFFDDAPFCIQAPAGGTGTTHCSGGTTLISGMAYPELDAVSLGIKYKWGGAEPLESLK